jgi:hypothetical protein
VKPSQVALAPFIDLKIAFQVAFCSLFDLVKPSQVALAPFIDLIIASRVALRTFKEIKNKLWRIFGKLICCIFVRNETLKA